MGEDVLDGLLYEYTCGQLPRHEWRVELSEAKRCLAQLAVLLLRMRQPLHQTVLVDVLYAAAALARVE